MSGAYLSTTYAGPIRVKRGGSLNLAIAMQDDAGAPVSIAGMTLTMQVADSLGVPVANLTATHGDATGTATVSADTSAWPIGALSAQITMVAGSVTTIGESFTIQIERPV